MAAAAAWQSTMNALAKDILQLIVMKTAIFALPVSPAAAIRIIARLMPLD